MKTRFQSPFLQEKRVSRTDGFNTLSSKIIRWMIFDGRDLFWFSFAGKFLREPFCRVVPRPCTPGLLSFHEESNQRRAKEDVSSLETPLRGTSPRELCCAKLSPPVCSDSGQMLGHLPTTSGSKYLHRCRSAPASGGCPILAHHFGQQAVMSLQSITKGKAFGALSCGSAETALLPLSLFYFDI